MKKLLVSACLLSDPVRYDGSFTGNRVIGSGVTAALLRNHDMVVFNQYQLAEAIDTLDSTNG